MRNYNSIQILFWLLVIQSLHIHAQTLVTVQGSGKVYVESNANAIVHGGLLFQNGSLLSNTGTITVKEIGTAGASNWIDQTSTPYFYGSGTVIFNGAGGHVATSNNIFGKIHMNASGNLTHGSDISVNNLLLDNGSMNTSSAYKMIVLTTPELALDKSATNTNFTKSWVNGNLRRYISPSTVDKYFFPIGDGIKSNPAVMDSLTVDPLNTISYIDAKFGPKPGNDNLLNVKETGLQYLGIMGQFYSTVNNGGVWYLTPDVNPTSGKYNLLLYFNDFIGLNDNSFGILKRSDASSSAADWKVPEDSRLDSNNAEGRLVASGFARRKNLTSFSQFGIGMTNDPLPLTLLSFSGVKENDRHLLRWETADEINTDKFIVERSSSFSSGFSPITSVKANGSVGQRNSYLAYDFTPLQGDNYYRLKMIDEDASFQYSKVIRLRTEVSQLLTIYPNPVLGNQLMLTYHSSSKGSGTLQITDMGGRILSNRVVSFVAGANRYELPLYYYARGAYRVSLWVNGKPMQTVPFVRQ